MERSKITITIQTLRDEIANIALLIAAVLGSVVFSITLISRLGTTGFTQSIIFESATWVGLILLAIFRKRIKIVIKGTVIISLLMILSLTDSYFFGLLGATRIYLVLLPIFSLLFFSVSTGIYIFIASLVVYLVIGWLHSNGVLHIPESYSPEIYITVFNSWLINAIHMAMSSMILIYIVYRFIGAFSNLISGLKLQNDQLAQQERNYREIFNSTTEAIFIHDSQNGRIIDFNDAVLDIYGYHNRSELKNLTVEDISENSQNHLPDKPLALIQKSVSSGPIVFDWRSKRKNGDLFFSEVSLKSAEIDGKQRVLAVVRDIDWRKKSELELIQARETAEITNAKLASIIENTNDHIWAFDQNYIIIYTNQVFQKEFQQSFGVKLEPGVNLLKSLPTPIQKTWKERYDKALQNQFLTFEDGVPTANGNIFVQVSMNPILADDQVIGVSCFGSDITERKLAEDALRQSEEKFRVIFENSPLGIFRFDKNGFINECNESLVEIIGSSKKDMVGINLRQHPDSRFIEVLKDVFSGKQAYFEGNYKSITANKITPVRFFFAPIVGKNGSTEGGICLAEDRTSNIQREEFKRQVEVARESVRFKQNFLANMSHEIRTPLTGVLGMIEILRQTDLTEKQQEFINTLKLSGENLKEIINQVLDYSKIEAGKIILKHDPFEFRSLINGAEILYRNMARDGVKFNSNVDTQIPEVIRGDSTRLSQIINNLVSNALKFTHKGSVIINAYTHSNVAGSDELVIKIEVKDTGIGVPEELKKNLFVPFSQIDNNDTNYREGTGLGLTICRELAILHGGEIGMESEFGKGSTFWFTFKALKNIDHENKLNDNNLLNSHNQDLKLRILYVEDKKVNQIVVQMLLALLGHEVATANNGKEAVNAYKPGQYDLILMDIQMPVMDGITATQILKSSHHNLPPIVGLSANAFEGDREKYMEMGMDDYLTKPIETNDFKGLVRRLFLK